MSEKVLCLPATAVACRGFSRLRESIPTFEQALFVERGAAEGDEAFRQVIPYVLLRHGDAFFSYARTHRGGEVRLHELRSIGVGGHVNAVDLPGGLESLRSDPLRVLAEAAQRELEEETIGATGAPLAWLGLICDDSVPVARVHLGVVFLADIEPGRLRLSDEGKMSDGRFHSLAELRSDVDAYEGWSRLVIEGLTE